MSRILLFSLLIFCTAAGCTKNNDEPQLPVPTQEGKNILACKVNGQVQIYKGKRTTFNDNGVEYDPYIDKLRIAADNSDYNDNIEMLLPGSPDSVVIGIKYFFSIRKNSFLITLINTLFRIKIAKINSYYCSVIKIL